MPSPQPFIVGTGIIALVRQLFVGEIARGTLDGVPKCVSGDLPQRCESLEVNHLCYFGTGKKGGGARREQNDQIVISCLSFCHPV